MKRFSGNGTSFQPKYLVGWTALGLLIPIIILISPDTPFDAESLIIGPGVSLGAGGLCMTVDAGVNYQWRFKAIQYPAFIWYIYPIFAFLLMSIGFAIGIVFSILTSPFRS